MKKFLNKAKESFSHHQSNFQSPLQSEKDQVNMSPPTPNDVFRYRYHLGTNLGSIFVLERWLSGSMFLPSASGDSELDAVTAFVRERGVDEARRRWEQYYRDAVTDGDFDWLVNVARCTSIRLPVGWWMMGGDFTRGSPWEEIEGVHAGAWDAVREIVTRARSHGIGVLIDLHGLPGGANSEDHSGTSSGRTELWGNRDNLDLARRVLRFIAREVHNGMEGVIGIQVVNEAVFNATGMYDWYDQVIQTIGEVDESIPIYISDGWDLGRCLNWTTSRSIFGHTKKNPIVVDTHKYYTFDEKDRSRSPQEIIAQIPGELGELDGKEGSLGDRGEAQIIVGEWSCVLDGRTWSRVQPQEKDGLVSQFGHTQSQKWSQRAGGSFFWTYKMDWMDGGEWGFVEQTKRGNIFVPPYLTLSSNDIRNRAQVAQQRRGEMAAAAQQAHEDYWNRTSPGQPFEHWLYGQGWDAGFSDSLAFFTARAEGRMGNAGQGGDKIGCLEIWIKKRMLEADQRGAFKWEWEQGFRSGVKAFESVVGI
ncbi:glycoside hydrolase superfamily [Tricladium varicosporioides]|nr:glycoside hydrolase superfamily [Hymenoscyphus varicosporioides]